MATSADPLLQPLKIGSLTLRNRVMSTSHAFGIHENSRPSERYQRYHEEKARGGIALTMFGGSSNIAPDSARVFGQLHVGNDDVIPMFRKFADRIHAHGSALMCQITHLGGRTSWRADHWLPVLAPSRSRERLHRAIAKEMDAHDIERVIKSYGDAANRCREGGLDGLEVMASGHLLGQFWTSRINRRTDEYGGSLENRCRFGLRVFEEIRRRAGDDFVVGMRMSVGLFGDADIDEKDRNDCEEYRAIARIYADSGLLDFLNLNFGRNDTEYGTARAMPGMEAPLAPYLARIGEFRQGINLPVFHACRVLDTASARHAVQAGLVEMIGMTRAHIADPHIVTKIRAGHEDRIRPCVGAAYCSWLTRCIHNPSTANEARYPHEIEPASERKRVVIVGAGPGGLEAARVSAERGHEVVVFEATANAGGQLRLAAQAPSRRDIVGIIDWRLAEAERLGARFHYNRLADAETIMAENPDHVVIATGGLPDGLEEEIPGAELCATVAEMLDMPSTPQGPILLYDGTGMVNASIGAEVLIARGAELVFVSPDRAAIQEAPSVTRAYRIRNLYAGGVRIIPDHRLAVVQRTQNRLMATLVNELTGAETEIECAMVVIEHGTVPIDEVYADLRPHASNAGVTDVDAIAANRPQDLHINPAGRFSLHRIGDAVSSRDAAAAILDAFRLCREF